MPNQVETKTMDPEAELSNVMRRFQNLAPECSIEKRIGGTPQLAPQEKQIRILKNEMTEAKLCINLARKGQHAVRDASIKNGIQDSIIEYEHLDYKLRDEKAQQAELDLLNYQAVKRVEDLAKQVPSEADALSHLENAYNCLRRMENRLDLAMKRFCVVNFDNKSIREEIHRLLVERNSFNIQWKQTINNLAKGKEYLMDILEIASKAFSSRDEATRILETLKWKGLYQLNKDITEMQTYDGELNHLAKLEEFLRVKGSRRICEADEIEEAKSLEEIARCEQQIAWHDSLLENIFEFAGSDRLTTIIQNFNKIEIENYSKFVLLCEIMEENTFLKRDLEMMRQRIMDQHDINQARVDVQARRLTEMKAVVAAAKERTEQYLQLNMAAEATIFQVIKAFDELFRLAKCEFTPLLRLLGNHREVTKWNVRRFIKLLETEVKDLIYIAYGIVKPPEPTPVKGKQAGPPPSKVKTVSDPRVKILRPNKIENLVPYQPCAYCVEDYIMNLVFETPAVPADKEYVQSIFHAEDVNTKFGIFTLTVPALVVFTKFLPLRSKKRHPYRGVSKGD